jgi:SAM-dependent methyltransferase
MRPDVDTFFGEDVSAFTRELAELDVHIDPQAKAQNDHWLDRLTDATHRSLRACARMESLLADDGEQLKAAQECFRKIIAPWFDRSQLMYRAKIKPRGYPGDYKLLAAMYDNVPQSSGLGGYVDLYLLNSTLARAVRARLAAARRFLSEELSRRWGETFVLNVACGPCREYLDGIERADACHVHVTCVDQDEQALEYVKTHVMAADNGGPHIECARYNALRMSSATANVRKFGRCDIIYSIGLCDYIPDKHLVRMLRGWRESLNDDGVLYVALKDAARYDKTECQWLADWFFFQRTEEECRELYRQAGFDMDGLEMTRDPTGVIMNFVSRVRRPALVRVDVPAAEPREAAASVIRQKERGTSARKEKPIEVLRAKTPRRPPR